MNELTGEKEDWRRRVVTSVFGDDADVTLLIAWSTAIFGIYSGYCLYILWWEQLEKGTSGWTFALGFAAAATMSFVFELLRGAIEGHHHAWSRSRVISTVVMLAAFELFIIATHGAIEMPDGTFAGVAGAILGEQFASQVGAGWNLLALGMLWIVVALTIVSKLRRFVLGWPYPNSNVAPTVSLGEYLSAMGPDLRRGVKAGFQAGVIWGALSAFGYVFLFRAYFLAQWIHSNYADWLSALQSQQRHDLPALVLLLLYLPPFLAGLCAKYLGGWGLLVGVIGTSALAGSISSKENRDIATVWPALSMVLLLGSPILADPTARHDLLSLAILSAVIWGVPAMVLGGLAPLLRQPSHNPPVWGLVASAAGGVMIVVTLARFFTGHPSSAEGWTLAAATGLLFVLAFQLFRGSWLEEFWLLLALSIGTIIWGTTSLMQNINLFEMQRSAHTLITLPLSAPSSPAKPSDDLGSLIAALRTPTVRMETGILEILPTGVDLVRFTSNPCAEVQRWTPLQRAQFSTGLTQMVKMGNTTASADESQLEQASLQFDNLKEHLAEALKRAVAQPNVPPGEQIAEARRLDKELTDLDASLRQLPDLARRKTAPLFLGYGQPQSVCRPDLDSSLADLARVAERRKSASARLSDFYHQVSREVPAAIEQLSAKRNALRGERENLQLVQAQHLELTMTSSLGFWVTVGLLAIWRLTDRHQS